MNTINSETDALQAPVARYLMPVITYDFPVKGTKLTDLYRVINDWKMRLENIRQFYPSSIKDDDVIEFVKYLIEHQRNDTGYDFANGSWTVPQNVIIGDGAGFDFALIPSYLAISFLCYVKQEIPSIAKEFKELDKTIRTGLNSCSFNNLHGNGYEGTQQSLRGIEILAKGRVFQYVLNNPKISPKFLRAMSKAKETIENRLNENTGWMAIDEEQALNALKLLDGEKITIESTSKKEVAESLVDDIVEFIAEDFTKKINDEISSREVEFLELAKETLIIAEKSKPKYVVFKRCQDNSPVASEFIKLNTALNINEVVSFIKSKFDCDSLGITKSEYKEAIINILSKNSTDLRSFLLSNGDLVNMLEIKNEKLKENGVDVRASYIEFNYEDDKGYIYIHLMVERNHE